MARTPIHPGEHLAEELKELSISAAELARQIDVPVNRVTTIINGQRAITADTALRLGHWFGTSPEFWLNLQKLYELRLAREEVGDRVKRLPKLTERKRIKARRAAKVVLMPAAEGPIAIWDGEPKRSSLDHDSVPPLRPSNGWPSGRAGATRPSSVAAIQRSVGCRTSCCTSVST